MQLVPLPDLDTPRYPARRPRRGRLRRWARRTGAAVVASLAMGAAGCYGATAIDSLVDGGADGDVAVAPDGDTLGDADTGGDADAVGDADTAADADLPGRLVAWCEPDHRLAGEQTPAGFTEFACGDDVPADAPTRRAPVYMLTGILCGELGAWVRVEVSSPERLALLFPNGGGTTLIRARAPDGTVAVELTPERPCALLDVEAGLWVLEARPAGPDVDPEAPFAVSFDELYEY